METRSVMKMTLMSWEKMKMELGELRNDFRLLSPRAACGALNWGRWLSFFSNGLHNLGVFKSTT